MTGAALCPPDVPDRFESLLPGRGWRPGPPGRSLVEGRKVLTGDGELRDFAAQVEPVVHPADMGSDCGRENMLRFCAQRLHQVTFRGEVVGDQIIGFNSKSETTSRILLELPSVAFMLLGCLAAVVPAIGIDVCRERQYRQSACFRTGQARSNGLLQQCQRGGI